MSQAVASPDAPRDKAAGTPLGTAASIRLVAGREVRERLRARSFHVLTAALVLIILALGFVGRFADGGPDPLEVGIVADGANGIAATLERSAGAAELEVEVRDYDDVASARAALEDGEVGLVVVPADGTVLSDDAPPEGDLALVQQAWAGEELQRSLAEQGLDAEQVAEVLSTPPLEVRELDGGGEDDALAVLVGTFAAVLLFIALQTFGGYVLTGVVEEKSTAVVEILLVRVSADRLLAGKVIGIGVAALIQLAAAVAAGVAALAISGVDVPAAVWTSVPTTLLWFLGGYALYSTLFALAGSLVSRQEDAQAASAPIMTALVGAYLLVFIFGYVPDSTASRIMSVLPPIAPLLMPMRIAAGAASVLEIVLAAVLLIAATIGAWKLAGRIYERVLLRRGARIGWRAALRLGRSD